MEGGLRWQQSGNLDKVSFLLLVVTPNALKSKSCVTNGATPDNKGVCVYPIKGSAEIDYKNMPRGCGIRRFMIWVCWQRATSAPDSRSS